MGMVSPEMFTTNLHCSDAPLVARMTADLIPNIQAVIGPTDTQI